MAEVVAAQTKDGEQEIELNDAELQAAEAAESRLAAFEDEPVEDAPAASKAKEPKATPDAPVEDDDAPADDGKPADDSTPKENQLPDKYRRAAIHQGWTTEEIDNFVAKDPELASKTLEKLYISTNKISQDFARIGRGGTKDDGKKAESQDEFKPVDLTEMKKVYGDDDPAIKTIQALQEQVAALSKRQVAEKPASSQPAQNELLAKTVDTFFTASGMAPYTEFYGKGKTNDKTLTIEQSERRWELLTTADQIRDGAAAQGVQMGVDEALERAHLIVSDSFKSQAIRTELTNKLKTKSKGTTLKPKGSKEADLSKTDPAKALEEKTAARLAALKF